MAENVAQAYPTMQSLWQAYQEGNDTQNSTLLATIFDGKRNQQSLSQAIYRFMKSTNPKEMLC